MHYSDSELILNDRGGVYHLGIRPEELAQTVLLVGDPDRVKQIASFFDTIEVNHQHREFVTCTGTYHSQRISVISTGIGTDNIDIVLNELDALVNIDLKNRTNTPSHQSLSIIRIGTCGILQATIPVNSFILSTHALGLDNVPFYYKQQAIQTDNKFITTLKKQVNFPNGVSPYLVKSSNRLTALLCSDKTTEGITVTGCGFYAPQGRRLRLPLSRPDFIDELSEFNYESQAFINFEMECSALFALSTAFGHEATAICLGVANRKTKTFSTNVPEKMEELIHYVLTMISRC